MNYNNIYYNQNQTKLDSDLSFQEIENQYINKVENLLENERNMITKETWSKLNKNKKKQKLKEFAIDYCKEHNLNGDVKSLIIYLNGLLDKKLLQKIKDVVYDKEKEIISQIPALFYNQTSRKFTLKKLDKTSTTKSLNLGKTKTRKKIKEKIDDLEKE